jgi:hypothetical protein
MDFLKRKTEKAKLMSKIVKVGNGKPPANISDGDRPPPRAKGEKVTSEELRRLRELIRNDTRSTSRSGACGRWDLIIKKLLRWT